MKVLIIHNRYSQTGGEEKVVEMQKELLQAAGIDVFLYQRDYHEMDNWRLGKLQSMFTALKNGSAIRDIRKIVQSFNPDIAIVHNLYPIVSPAILKELHKKKVRIAMAVHNYRLFCPIGLFFRKGEICTLCAENPLREVCCTLHRCQGTVAGSFAFSLRGAWSRIAGYFNHVDLFLSCSQFQKSNLEKYGIPSGKIKVIPNFTDSPIESYEKDNYVAFVGRLSQEKGIDMLLEIASSMPETLFKVAGSKSKGYALPALPPNVQLQGFLTGESLRSFYGKAKALVFTSRVWEAMPLTPLEAMAAGTAVVAQRVSSIPEILDEECIFDGVLDGVTKLRDILSNDEKRRRIEETGREKIRNLFSPARYLKQLKDCLETGSEQ